VLVIPTLYTVELCLPILGPPILRAMPFAKQPSAQPMSRPEKRVAAAVGGVVVAALAAVGIWAATSPGNYGSSHDGCVTVTVPGSTGGALLHECGRRARSLCQSAFDHADKVSLLARPQCKLAGLAP
jgi:hypothetical protein